MSKDWLFSKKIDLLVLFIPVWAIWILAFLLPSHVYQKDIPLWIWVVFILGIDVSHVWSTIFRTYLDKEEFNNHRRILVAAPLMAFVIFGLLAGISTDLFWRLLAYFAVYHFIKQQYGFLALYRVRSGFFINKKIFKDKWVIYFSMLYPVLYWHLTNDRNFDWFVTGDFIYFKSILSAVIRNPEQVVYYFNKIGNLVYYVVISGWLIEEIFFTVKKKASLQTGKILWMLTTAANWYLGIVYFNSDLIFTLTNVVAHGVPYMALIFFYVERKRRIRNPSLSLGKAVTQITFMITIVFFLAFGEEYLWDLFLFREKTAFFSQIIPYLINVFENPIPKALAFGLLSVPQVTHYILDGYIWKGNEKNPYIKKIFKPQLSSG